MEYKIENSTGEEQKGHINDLLKVYTQYNEYFSSKFPEGKMYVEQAQLMYKYRKELGLSDEEIQKMKQEAEANADADKKAKETAEKINGADSMIFQTEKQLKEFGDKLSADKKEPIEAALEELKKAHESKDLAAIDAAMEKINEAWKVASEEMYKAQQDAQANGAGAQGNANTGSSSEGDNVEDVDFEEVK